MKILYLNIFEGCKEPDRLERIIAFLKKESPDIFGISELYDWDQNDFEKFKFFSKKTGFSNYIFGKSNFNKHTALFSKYPFEYKEVFREEFQSPLIKADIKTTTVKPLMIMLLHLRARNEDLRLKEIDLVLQKIDQNQPAVVLGDFNSLSPEDKYNEPELFQKMKAVGLEKFGKDKIRREVIIKILDRGLVDAVKSFSKDFEYSTPTDYNRDPAHFSKLRLDYIFITKNLLPYLRQAKILRSNETNQLSDHFPIFAEFDFSNFNARNF